ncbi:MAG: hypothetical protein FJ279_14655 [Planctomycetes bacterium]|nr:hypothetical protein [Planctomycetota bacterium]
MNSRERVLTTLGFTEPDRVPFFEQGVASNVASEVLGREAHTGGYLLGSSNVIHAGVPTRNFLAMVETCRSYGRY